MRGYVKSEPFPKASPWSVDLDIDMLWLGERARLEELMRGRECFVR